MPKDLREFIGFLESEHPDQLLRIDAPVDPANFDVTAILEHLNKRGERPLVIFEHPLSLKQEDSRIPVVSNVFATRERCALALGMSREDSGLALSLEYARRGTLPLPPEVITTQKAPVKEVIRRRDDVDTRELPIVIHSEGDYGPCLTMTLAVKDPDTGAYNASFIKAFYDFEDHQRLRITIHSPDSERALHPRRTP
jgi:2,5-furandicarboxylate decarboxylase 1